MNKTYPYEEEVKVHSISISNFTRKIEKEEYDPELLEFCRCICCICLLFTDLPEILCKWCIKK